MALGRRLFHLARTELNALLDKAARIGEDDEASGERLEGFSEAELEAELERRRLEREIEDRARRARPGGAPSGRASPRGGTGPSPRASGASNPTRNRPPSPADKVARAYAVLELKPGTSFPEVKQQYRKLMRKYHPDKHAGSPDKEKAAHELTQKLTEAYSILEQKLRQG